MKKEEFPTFLNEQPTIIFGRTGRELLIIAIGLGTAYLLWLRLGLPVAGNVFASDLLKGVIGAIIVVASIIVAFIKIAQCQLEEWAFIWLFYTIIPKVYLYTTPESAVLIENQQDEQEEEKTKFDDDDFEDD